MGLEIRRYQDIIAIKQSASKTSTLDAVLALQNDEMNSEKTSIIAFHCNNL